MLNVVHVLVCKVFVYVYMPSALVYVYMCVYTCMLCMRACMFVCFTTLGKGYIESEIGSV